MKIAIIAPPFIPVPPRAYGGTELFIAHLAEELMLRGHEVIVYANGESRLPCEVRSLFPKANWPLEGPMNGTLRNLHHAAWSLADAAQAGVDVAHLNDALAVPLARFVSVPALITLHHPHEPELSTLYDAHPDVTYITISHAQQRKERMRKLLTIHHGIRLSDYTFTDRKDRYLSFLGRIAPVKGPHLAIDIARRAGIPLKIAGEIQPVFQEYWERQIAPNVDGTFIEYVGPATRSTKSELLGRSMALLFPIQWEEPFGLVMIEAMACGTPVLAFPGGAVEEIVSSGVSGWVSSDVEQLARHADNPGIDPASCRDYVERLFSVERMAEDYERVYQRLRREADTNRAGATTVR